MLVSVCVCFYAGTRVFLCLCVSLCVCVSGSVTIGRVCQGGRVQGERRGGPGRHCRARVWYLFFDSPKHRERERQRQTHIHTCAHERARTRTHRERVTHTGKDTCMWCGLGAVLRTHCTASGRHQPPPPPPQHTHTQWETERVCISVYVRLYVCVCLCLSPFGLYETAPHILTHEGAACAQASLTSSLTMRALCTRTTTMH
jgi:hypothetical protein